MGLLSFLRNIRVNNKLKKADKFTNAQEYSVAESLYVEILKDHPEAVTHLALLYLKQSKGQSNSILFSQKGLDCEAKLTSGVSNATSFNKVKEEIVNDIYLNFSEFKKKNQLEKALDFSKVLILYSKDHNIVYEHYKCYFEYALSLEKDKINETEIILEEIYTNIKVKNYLAKLCTTVKNELFTRAVEYSKTNKFNNSNKLCSIIIDDDNEAQVLFIENCINIVETVKNSDAQQKILLLAIKALKDKSIALKYLEQLIKDIPSLKDYFVKVVIDICSFYIKERKYKEAVALLKKSIDSFPKQEFYNLLIKISEHYRIEKAYPSAVEILNGLIEKHPDSEPLLAKCFVEQSLGEKTLDVKRELLVKGLSFKNKHSTLFNKLLFEDVLTSIISAITELSLKYGEYGYYSDAYGLLDVILDSAPDSFTIYIRIKILEIKSITNLEKQRICLNDTITELKNKSNDLINIDLQGFDLLFKELIDITIKIVTPLSADTAISELHKLKNRIKNEKQTEILKNAIEQLDNTLALLYFNKGKSLELQNNFEDALVCYEFINEQFSETINIHNEALIRKYISLLKSNNIDKINESKTRLIDFLASQKRNALIIDLAYRFAIFLIRYGSPESAKELIDQYLPKGHKSTKILNDYYSDQKIKKSISILNEYNEKIKSINCNELPLADAIDLYEKMQYYEDEVTEGLVDLSSKIITNKDIIKVYILSKLFEAESYLDCFTFIETNFIDFYKDDKLFRNIAIASLGAVLTGGMTETNFKKIISTWLTANFNNHLFIKSLADTTWDDNFTFTLQDTLGYISEEEIDKLPDNINNEDITDSNISIGKVQKSLLTTFEGALSNGLYPQDLSSLAMNFYQNEKAAISALNSLESETCELPCTPYFTVYKKELFKSISSTLDNELNYWGINTEEVLKVGILYGLSGGSFKEYSDAIILKNKALEVVNKMNHTQIGLIFSKTNISKIKSYSELFKSFTNDLRMNLSDHIKSDINYETITSNYLKICSVVSDVNLSYMLSNFANRACIAELNDEIIPTSKGIKFLCGVYDIINDNQTLNKNLQSVINNAVIELIMEGDASLQKALNEAIEKHSKEFDKGIVDTLEKSVEIIVLSGKYDGLLSFVNYYKTKSSNKYSLDKICNSASEMRVNVELSEIIGRLNNNSISILQGLRETYHLYQNNKDHRRLCENLVIACGNAIHLYVMKNSTSSAQVCSLLDDICRNRSVTFRSSAAELSNQRREILNNLPYDLRRLIEGGYSPGHTLNSDGIALKKGLDYLQRLSA